MVDNASSDGAVAILAAEFPEVRVIANAEVGTGFSDATCDDHGKLDSAGV